MGGHLPVVSGCAITEELREKGPFLTTNSVTESLTFFARRSYAIIPQSNVIGPFVDVKAAGLVVETQSRFLNLNTPFSFCRTR